ncbi:hypothetical protein L0337_10560, partial [candidate division KSB1 bacterium]|nr:hypothetical protein [candidate division KSB1 bacterium]
MSKQILRALCPSSLNKRAITQLDHKRLSRFKKWVVLALLFALAAGSNALAQEPYQRLVRKFETPELGIPNPAGLAFSPAAGALLVAPSPGTVDLSIVILVGDLAGSATVATAVSNPVNMAFDGKFNSLLFFDAGTEELIEIKAGANGRPQPSPGAITRFNAQPFVVKHAQGMTLDPETGDLFFLVVPAQPAVPGIVRIVPNPQDRFASPVVSNIVLSSLRQYQLRGIAFNPSDGHFYIMSQAEQELFEVTQKGEVLTTRDLSAFGLGDVQNMAFAPSGDQTDDPAVMSLYIADSGLSSKQGLGDITELSLTQPAVQDLSAITAEASLVRTVLTSQWSPPSPDPCGIAYIPSSNRLIISDSEVEEMSIYAGVNYWEVTLASSQIREYTTYPAFSDEPTDVAYNPNNRQLYFSDDTGTRRVYELNPGSDGLYNTSDDIVTSFKTGDFGSYDPEGITYDTFQGHLFIADGVNAEVYEISPGANGRFDGVPPSGDDVMVQHFDTASLGLSDPEGVEFNTDNGNLYIVSRSDEIVVETTRTGTAVGVIDIGFLNARSPAGLAHAPTSVNPSEKSLYIVARGVDNDSDPNENDGKMYEISLGSSTPSLSINDITVTEGNSGTVNAVFAVTLSAASSQTVTVDYATADGSATAGSDYVAASGQVTFQPGQTSQPVTVVVNGDELNEPNETFFVNLSNAVNATIGNDQGTGTITNDDGLQQPVTVSFQDGVGGYTGTRDTKLVSGSPTTNYGTASAVELDGSPDISALVSWDLTSIPAGSI